MKHGKCSDRMHLKFVIFCKYEMKQQNISIIKILDEWIAGLVETRQSDFLFFNLVMTLKSYFECPVGRTLVL